MTNAEVCRRWGWAPGTIFQVEDDWGAARFVITAIGESLVLGKQLSCINWGWGWKLIDSPYEQSLGVRMVDATKVDAATEAKNFTGISRKNAPARSLSTNPPAGDQ